MHSTILTLVYFGRILSDLPRNYVLDSETPNSIDESALVLSIPTGRNSQHFLAGVGDDPNIFFLATLDLKYVLHVSDKASPSVMEYVEATEEIIPGGPYPSFITDRMLFSKNHTCSGGDDVFRFETVIYKGNMLDVQDDIDSLGRPIIVYPHNGDSSRNQCFSTQNPS